MVTGTMTSKGQITVPKEVREALGLTPGTQVAFRRNSDGEYVLSTAPRPLVELAGTVHYDGPALTIADMDAAITEALRETT